jgi:hypothetical protein
MSRLVRLAHVSLCLLILGAVLGALGQQPARATSAEGPTTAMGYTLAPAQPGLPALQAQLTSYLKAHPQSAEDYVISQFKTHDVVFLGEGRQHCTRERTTFLKRLIPMLYKAGVYNVGYEFATSEDQSAIDRLLTAPRYDEDAAFTILQDWDFGWALQEYADVFRAAWEVNHRLPAGAPKFRILGIDVRPDYRRLKPGMDPDSLEARGIIVGGDRDMARDNRMADVLRKEVLSKGLKGLMFNGMGHSQRKYSDLKADGTTRRIRFAILIAKEIGDSRVTCINLESPQNVGRDLVVDAVLAALPAGAETLGFGAAASPVGRVSMMVGGTRRTGPPPEPWKIEDFYDGYVFLSMRTPWAPATFNGKYITPERVKWAKAEGLLPDLPTVTAESVKKTRADSYLGNVKAAIERGRGY